MNNPVDETKYPVYWKGQLIGSISKLGQPDMWYFDAEWHPAATSQAAEFMGAIAHLIGKAYWQLETEAQLVWVDIPALKLNCTVVHVPVDNMISLRMMTNPELPQS